MPAPVVMIVAAWVSCRLSSVTVVPSAVVAVRLSGIGPTTRELFRQNPAGPMNAPRLTIAVDGPMQNSTSRMTSSFFAMSYGMGVSTAESRSSRQESPVGQAAKIVNDTGRASETS